MAHAESLPHPFPPRINDDDLAGARVAPHNIDLEQALLGALLVNNDAMEKVGSFLEPHHFYSSLHGRIFDVMRRLIAEGRVVTPLTLNTYLESDAAYQHEGGGRYLLRLVEACVAVQSAGDYGQAIFDLSTRRELIRIGEDIVATAYDSPLETPPQEQVEEAERQLYAVSEKNRFGGGFVSLRQAMQAALKSAEAAMKRDGATTGVATGFKLLDWMLGGFQPSDLLIIAGRPAMGKTSLATNIAVNAARARLRSPNEGAAIAFYSLEMSSEQLAGRIMSEVARISSNALRTGKLDERKFQDLVEAIQTIEAMPLYIDDSPGLSIAQIAARSRRMKRNKAIGLDMIIIDYLQLIAPSGTRKNENRVQEVTEITKGLKSLAKELNVPVVALSQLNRGVDAREDKRPVLADLRESGSIEQDADVVMFVYREEYYHKSRKPEMTDEKKYTEWLAKQNRIHGTAQVIVEKHRHGPTGPIDLAFDEELTKFDNLARDQDYAH